MKNSSIFFFYATVFAAFAAVSYFTLTSGQLLQLSKSTVKAPLLAEPNWREFTSILVDNVRRPLPVILMQIGVILIAKRALGFLCKKIGQPNVIGEIVAGIFLGPSVLGQYFPQLFHFLFPIESLGNLQYLSHIGLILFMFVIGLELDFNLLKNKSRDAAIISQVGILFPFALGLLLAYYLYMNYAPTGVSFISFSLFIGVAISITAFPVLARIIQQRGLGNTRVGTIAITCAAADDIVAWCMLAAVVAVVKTSSVVSLINTLIMAVIYIFAMFKVVGPVLSKFAKKQSQHAILNKSHLAVYFIVLILSSYVTEVIGIHALFGAFMAGVIMPANIHFKKELIYKIEDVSLFLLLPLFFVFTGLKTHINLLNSAELWTIVGVITSVAFIGKFLGCALTARFIGQTWKDSLMIGALMNTRGLVELVVLNVGYDLHVLSQTTFAMFIIMALLTTFMTGPLLDLIDRFWSAGKVKQLSVIQEGIDNNI